MDINTMNTSGPSVSGPSNEKRSVGPVIGLIIILVIILIGGIYFFWTSRTANAPKNEGTPAVENGEAVDTRTILNQNSSDDVSAIEADLDGFNESDISGLDLKL